MLRRFHAAWAWEEVGQRKHHEIDVADLLPSDEAGMAVGNLLGAVFVELWSLLM